MHASTTPSNRKYRPRNYGSVIAGDGSESLTSVSASAHVCTTIKIDLGAFSQALPPRPAKSQGETERGRLSSEYWAASARQEIAYYRAIREVARQVWRQATTDVLRHSMTAAEQLLHESATDYIKRHHEAGGTEWEKLISELATACVETAP